MKILTSQHVGTCKSAYIKGYALNWVLTFRNVISTNYSQTLDESEIENIINNLPSE